MKNYWKGKKILITGGTGSLGQVLVRNLLKFEPEVIRIYSRDETKQFDMMQKFSQYNNLRYLIGNVRDLSRLIRAVEDIDVIFHTAALKHVEFCEYNPFEAMKTNVVGTQNVIDAALEVEVEKVISTSTDKATNPCNTMGTTKLMAEKLIAAANYHKGKRKTVFSAVRFGNVLGTRGSVVPLFISQIKQGGPITLTDSKMIRFMMSLEQAANLVFEAAEKAIGGEIFVLKMPIVRIIDLVEVLIEDFAPLFGYKPGDIKIQTIGKRAGEKMYEELITEEETDRTIVDQNMYVIKPQLSNFSSDESVTYFDQKQYTSNGQWISKTEIREILKSAKIYDKKRRI